jgi:hypothetical protein
MKIFIAIIGIIFILAAMPYHGLALEWKGVVIEEKSYSMDLNKSYQISANNTTAESGLIFQDIIINDTASGLSAQLSLISIFDQEMRKMDEDSFLEMLLGPEMSQASETMNRSWQDGSGRKVVVHRMSPNNVGAENAEGYDLALWKLEDGTYAILASYLDQNATDCIIASLSSQGPKLPSVSFFPTMDQEDPFRQAKGSGPTSGRSANPCTSEYSSMESSSSNYQITSEFIDYRNARDTYEVTGCDTNPSKAGCATLKGEMDRKKNIALSTPEGGTMQADTETYINCLNS